MNQITKLSVKQYIDKLDADNLVHFVIAKKLKSLNLLVEWLEVKNIIEETAAVEIKALIRARARINKNSLGYKFNKKINQITQPIRDKSPFMFRYMGFVLLLLFVSALGAGMYNQFYKKAGSSLAYPVSPTSPGSRTVSFQGRLTDNLGNPITANIAVEYNFYNAIGQTNPILTRSCNTQPDQDGIFNNLIGEDCGAVLPDSLFTENANIYLGVKVGSDAEMTPRQQIANVGYAINSETLQGLPPGTAPSTIPFINSTGSLQIAAANPKIESTQASATFAITSASAVTIQSADTGDINLNAAGTGNINFQIGSTDAMTIDNNGQVGIGTAIPNYPLDVQAGTGIVANFSGRVAGANALSNNEFVTLGQMATGAGPWTRNSSNVFLTSNTDNVGIGTTNPQVKFVVSNGGASGIELIPDQTTNYIQSFDRTASVFKPLQIITGSGTGFYQNIQGNVGIGTTNPLFKLDIDGSVNIASGQTYNVNGAQIALNNLSDVFTSAPVTDQILRYNGTNWINGSETTVNGGSGVDYFYVDSPSDISTYAILNKVPDPGSEIHETVTANNNRVLFDSYASASTGLGGSQIDAGVWSFDIWAYVDNITGGTSSVDIDVYKRTAGGTETLLFNVNSGTLDTSLGVNPNIVTTIQQAFAINATDRLITKVYGKTTATADRTVHFLHGGNAHYSHLNTPLVVRHNDLAGLQGGTFDEYYHLTAAEYSGSGTGIFARMNAPIFTAGIGVTGNSTFNNNLTIGGNVGIGTTNPVNGKLEVNGKIYTTNFQMTAGATNGNVMISDASGNASWTNLSTLPVGNANTTDNYHIGGTANYLTKFNAANDTLVASGLYEVGGNIGIGITTPGSPLDIYKSYGNTDASAGAFNINSTGTLVNTYVYGQKITATQSSAGAGGGAVGLSIIATRNGTGVHGVTGIDVTSNSGARASGGSATSYYGGKFILNGSTALSSTATALKYYGTYGEVSNLNPVGESSISYGVYGKASSVDVAYGLYGAAVSTTTSYGVYASGSGGATNFGVYSAAGTNYFNGNVGIGTTAPGARLDVRTTGTTDILNLFETGGTEVMTVLESGNVGIGTTNPGSSLEVYKTAYPIITVNSGTYKGTLGIDTGTPTLVLSAESNLPLGFNANNARAMTILASGNVGIGTTNPSAKLDISGTAYPILEALRLSNVANIAADRGVSQTFYVPTGTASSRLGGQILIADDVSGTYGTYMAFSTELGGAGAINERMRIDKNGNVGIGTTAPGSALDINGEIRGTSFRSRGDATHYGQMNLYDGSGNMTFNNVWSGGDSNIIFTPDNNFIINSGNVGIGTTNPNNFKLQVAGSVGPQAPDLYDLGSSANHWNNIYANSFVGAMTPSGFTQGPVVFGGAAGALAQDNGLFWDNTSKELGIGTTNPGAKLDVEGSTVGELAALRLSNTHNSANDSVAIYFGTYSNSYTAQINAINRNDLGAAWSDLSFSTRGGGAITEKVRITAAGNVGIGTTNPGALLSLSSSGAAGNSTALRFDSTYNTANNRNWVMGLNRTTYGDFSIVQSNAQNGDPSIAGTTRLYIENDGNVGIGTATPGTAGLAVMNGNVGIGTTGPTSLLHIRKDQNAGTALNIENQTSGTTGYSRQLLTTPSANAWLDLYSALYTTSGANVADGAFLGANGTGGLSIGGVNGTSGLIKFFTDGSADANERMRITNGGNVGIGTTNPGATLHVYRSSLTSPSLTPGAAATMIIGQEAPGELAIGMDSGSPYEIYMQGRYLGGTARNISINPLGGNVGIGTTNPSLGKLQVAGRTYTTDFTMTNGASNGKILVSDSSGLATWTTPSTLSIGNADTTDNYHISGSANYLSKFNAANNTLVASLLYDNGTNVGIGITNPLSKFVVLQNSGISTSMVDFTNNLDSDIGFFVSASGASDKVGLIQAVGNLAFGAGSAEKMRINTSGNVGIGTTNPGELLTINNASRTEIALALGGTIFGRLANASQEFSGQSNTDFAITSAGTNSKLQLGANGVLGMTLNSSGNVGIGTTSPGYKLTVISTGTAANSQAAFFQGANGGYTAMAFTGDNSAEVGAITTYGGYIMYGSQNAGLTGSNAEIAIKASSHDVILGGAALGVVSGNVGIGTTNPSLGKLQVAGRTYTTDFTMTNGASNGKILVSDASGNASWTAPSAMNVGNADTVDGYNISGNANYITKFNAANNSLVNSLLYDDGTNVGIGTTAPQYKLSLQSSVDNYLSSIYNTGATANAGGLYIRTDGNGNLLTLNSSGSDIMTVSPTSTTFNTPTSFTASGDVSFAYDINMTNSVASYIKSAASMTMQAGEVFNSSDLTMRTFNYGDLVLDTGVGVTSAGGTIKFNDSNVKGATDTTSIAFADTPTTVNNFRTNFTNESLLGAINETYNMGIGASNGLWLDGGNYVYPNATYATNLVVPTGNVGIGNTNPSSKLTINTGNILFSDNWGMLWDAAANTNILASAADGFKFTTNGTEKVRIANGGNVGIGTTNPGAPLEISTPTGVNFQTGIRLQKASGYGQTDIQNYYTTGSNYGLAINIGAAASAQMVVNNNGNVGIGTINPLEKLNVSVADNAYGMRIVSNASDNTFNGIRFSYDAGVNTNDYYIGKIEAWKRPGGGGDLILNAASASSAYNSNQLVLAKNGNVGIGTTNPQGKFHVSLLNNQAAYFASQISSGESNSIVLGYTENNGNYEKAKLITKRIDGSARQDFGIAINTGADSTSATIGDSKIYIKGDTGNVGIGTTNPGEKLSVAGNVLLGLSPNMGNSFGSIRAAYSGDATTYKVAAAIDFIRNESGDGRGGDIYFKTNAQGESGATTKMVINGAGNVGIGTTNPNNFKLQVAGSVGPQVADSYDLGSSANHWNNIYANSFVGAMTPSGFTQGPVVFGGAAGALAQDNGLFWDNTSKELGIGTTNPASKLHVNGGDLNLSFNGSWNSAQARNSDKISILSGLKGRQANDNPDFLKGLAGYNIYDNAASGQITMSLIGDTSAPSASGQVMQLAVANGAPSPSPGFGGFNKGTVLCGNQSVGHCVRMGDRIIETIWAKIPVGYSIAWASNSMGTGGNQQWLSATAGTGNWEEYITSITMGPTATSTNYFYISGATRPVTWYVASLSMIDVDQIPDVDRAPSMNIGYLQGINLANGEMVSTGNSYLAVNSGNVGIGTTNPQALLNLESAVPRLKINGTTSNALRGIDFSSGGTNFAAVEANASSGEMRIGSGPGAGWGGYLTFYQDQVEAMRIDSAGNVGIGTISPTSKLNISLVNPAGWGGNLNALKVTSPDSNYDLSLATAAGNGGVTYSFNPRITTTTYSGLTIGAFGYIGVGTVDPQQPMQINSTTEYALRLSNSTGAFYYDMGRDGTTGAFKIQGNQSGANNILLAPTSGNVGIGTTAPGSLLDVNGRIRSSSINVNLSAPASDLVNNSPWYGLGTSNMTLPGAGSTATQLAGYFGLNFATAAGNAMVLTSGGNVGIGTTAPGAKLDVAGGIHQSSGYGTINPNSNDVLYGAGGGSPNAGSISFGDNTGWLYNIGTKVAGVFTPRLTIVDSGNVGIGTASPNNFKLQVAGSVGPQAPDSYDLGSSANHWNNIYANSFVGAMTPSGFTQGPVVFGGAAGALAQDNGLFWDNTNKRLGIGTVGPVATLDVSSSNFGVPASSGSTNLSMMRIGYGDHSWGGGEINFGVINSAVSDYAGWIQVQAASAYATQRPLLLNPIGGNVGIGTIAPGAKLDVATSSTWGTASIPALNLSNTGSAGNVSNPHGLGAISWATNGVPTTSIEGVRENPGAGNSSALVFRTGSSGGGSEYMRINSSGNVGIGTTNPLNKLQVLGDIGFGNANGVIGSGAGYGCVGCASASTIQFYDPSNGAMIFNTGYTTSYYSFKHAGTEVLNLGSTGVMSLPGNGYTIYGPNSSWGASLVVGGNGNATNNATVATTNGNLHLDAAAGASGAYLNFYHGTGGVIFGNGATGTNANVSAAGAFTGTNFVGPGTGLTGTAASLTSGRTNVVNSPDGTRNAADKLPTTTPYGVRYDFATAGTANGGGNYSGVMTYAVWDGTSASTGNNSYQLSFSSTVQNGGTPYLSIRNGIDSTWNSWYKIWSEANDGTGSTLDADTTDTYHLNQVVTTAGTPTFASMTLNGALGMGANTITSGLINGQTISSAANFTGTLAVANDIQLGTGGNRAIGYYGAYTSGYFTKMELTSTAGYGTYGPVSSDWALYNRFGGDANRGWIWQLASTNVASLSGAGHMQLAGNLTAIGYVNSSYFMDYQNNAYGIDPAGTTNFGGYSLKVTGGSLLAVDSGNVGIGTTNPLQKLDVSGNINLNTGGDSALFSTYKGSTGSIGLNIWIGGGGQSSTTGYRNYALGFGALQNNTAGYENIAIGNAALRDNNTGYLNTAIGTWALASNTTGRENIAIGREALQANITGYLNTAVGRNALYHNTFNGNSAIGYSALQNNTTGGFNTATGTSAGGMIDSGSYNTFLGFNAGYGAYQLVSASNSMALGNAAYTTASDQVVIGNSSITQTLLRGKVGIGNTNPAWLLAMGTGGGYYNQTTGAWVAGSDRNYKKDIVDLTKYGLDTIKNLRPVSYTVKESGVEQVGFIAQEVKEIVPELVSGEEGSMALNYGGFAPILAKGIQEQEVKIDANTGDIASLAAKIKNIVNVEDNKTTFQGTILTDVLNAGNALVDTFTATSATISSLIANNIAVGMLNAENAVINTLTAVNANIDNLIANNITANNKIISPVVETKQLITEEITASDEADLAINIGTILPSTTGDSILKKVIFKGFEGKTVASIDSLGNATFSGSLVAHEASFEAGIIASTLNTKEASISGNLIAKNVNSENIQAMTNDINDIQTLLADIKNQPIVDTSNTTNLATTTNLTNIGTGASNSFDDITVANNANMYNASVANSLAVGNLLVKDNTIMSLSWDLKLTALSTVNILDGAIVMAKDGSITSRGSMIAMGGVRTNNISPVSQGADLNINIGSTNVLGANTKFKITNELGETVASIDSSGSAKFNEIALAKDNSATNSAAIIAKADNFTENGIFAPAIQTTNRVAGNAILPNGENEIVIYNEKISKDSLVYVTATSPTQNKTLFVADKNICDGTDVTCKSYFKVAIDDTITSDIKFNWWIVN